MLTSRAEASCEKVSNMSMLTILFIINFLVLLGVMSSNMRVDNISGNKICVIKIIA